MVGFRQEPTITEYLKVHILLAGKSNRVGGTYATEVPMMKDGFDTLTSTMTEIRVELCN